jgi:hypothetical protein
LSAVLIDLPIEIEVGRWRTSTAAGRDVRRARALLAEDLDAVEEQWGEFEGPAKLQLCGPLTASAGIELRSGDALASDQVARADLTASLVEGLVAHVADLRRRVPGATWVVQLDEPRAASVTRGSIARPSGWGTVAPVPEAEALSLVRQVVDAMHGLEAGAALHCCDADPDWAVLVGSGADALSLACDQFDDTSTEVADHLASWWGQGGDLWCQVEMSPATEPDDAAADLLSDLRRLRSVLGSDPEGFADRLVLTPRCGVAAGGPVSARAYADLRTLMKRLPEI